jgi:hypothetical protein
MSIAKRAAVVAVSASGLPARAAKPAPVMDVDAVI